MASGTGITTGPYTPASGSSFSVSDPSKGVPSAMVQVQNASGFILSVLSAGAPYTIQPQTATTIPTVLDGSSITITPTSTVQNQTGTISLVWLLDGQTSPIPDGFMGNATAASRSGGTYTVSTTSSITVPLISTDQSITLYFSMTGVPVDVNPYSIIGNVTGIIYATGQVPYVSGTTNAVVGPVTVYGSIDTSVTVAVDNLYGSILPVTVQIVIGSAPGVPSTPVRGGSIVGVGQYTYGGALRAGNPALTAGTPQIMLSAPGTGYAYRLHSWTIYGVVNSGTSSFIALLDSSVTLATMNATAQAGFLYLGGLLVVNDEVRVNTNTGSYGAGSLVLAYDLIEAPTLT